jgi:outer membrane protein assembly factor BamB
MKSLGTRALLVMLAAGLLLGGCDTLERWFSSGGKVSKLKGTRIAIMATSENLGQDASIKDTSVVLPPPYVNKEWPGQGGYASNAMYHLSAPGPLKEAWTTEAGEGSGTDSRLTASPVIGGGKIFTLDSRARVFAFNAATGEPLWHKSVASKGHTDLSYTLSFGMFGEDKSIDPTKGFGGGIAYDAGKLFVTDGFGNLTALNAANGKKLWAVNLGVPIFTAPAVNGGRVFVASQDNHFHAYAANNGRELWDSQGIVESAGILVSTNAAISGQFVIIPFTSGELFALRVQNGRPAWSDMLTRTGNTTALSALDDIAARPVIDRDMVFAISHSGVMAAISIDSGERAWTRDIGGIQTPWVAGDYLYVLNGDGLLICLTRKEGRVKWIRQMPRRADPADPDDETPAVWSGPVLVSDRLILVSSGGKIASVSPYTGKMLGQTDIPDGAFIPPVVANGTVYVLTNGARLVALR